MCISNGSSAMITHGGRGDCQESNPYVNLNRNGTSSGKTSYILYFRQLTEFLEKSKRGSPDIPRHESHIYGKITAISGI